MRNNKKIYLKEASTQEKRKRTDLEKRLEAWKKMLSIDETCESKDDEQNDVELLNMLSNSIVMNLMRKQYKYGWVLTIQMRQILKYSETIAIAIDKSDLANASSFSSSESEDKKENWIMYILKHCAAMVWNSRWKLPLSNLCPKEMLDLAARKRIEVLPQTKMTVF